MACALRGARKLGSWCKDGGRGNSRFGGKNVERHDGALSYVQNDRAGRNRASGRTGFSSENLRHAWGRKRFDFDVGTMV